MNTGTERLARSVLTAALFLASFAPTLAVTNAAIRGDLGALFHADLLAASAMVATIHALVLWRRLRQPRPGTVPARYWIAAVYDVALTATITALAAGVFLSRYVDQTTDAVESLPILVLWMLLQAAGITAGELGWFGCTRMLAHSNTAPGGQASTMQHRRVDR